MLARRLLQPSFSRQLWTTARMGACESNEAATQFVQSTVANDCVVVFSKTTCGYCRMAKDVLSSTGVDYTAIELNQRQDGSDIQRALKGITGMGTVPQVFIGGKCIGGGTETKDLHKQGKLLPLMENCRNLPPQQAATGEAPSKL